MFMPKKDDRAIKEYLFKEGVMVAEKDLQAPKHPELENVPNLHVIKVLQSFKYKGYVREQFAWRHYYWYLTNSGIEYLRNFLNLPPEIVPNTLKRQARIETSRPRPNPMRSEGSRLDDRMGYRRMERHWGPDKKGDVGVGSGEIEFRQGIVSGSSKQ